MDKYPDHLPTITLSISQALVDKYSEVAEDHNPIHKDTKAAIEGPFGKPVAHGMLVLSTASQIMTTAFGKRWAEKGSLKVRWKSPTAIPSNICTSAQLKSASEEQIKYQIECKDKDDILLFSGTATLHLDD